MGEVCSSADQDLTACIPLSLDGQLMGAIAIFRLLPQKPNLEAIDYELFDMLAIHAAIALHQTRFDAESGSVAHKAS